MGIQILLILKTVIKIKRDNQCKVLKHICSECNKLKISISHYSSGSIKLGNLLTWKSIPRYSQLRGNACPRLTKETRELGD